MDRQARRQVYNSALWRKVRREQLTVRPLCQLCAQLDTVRVAQHVDHVVPLAEGGAPYDNDNLQSLCASCHSQKTRAEVSGGPMPQHQGCCVHGHPRDPQHPWNADGAGCPKCGVGGSP